MCSNAGTALARIISAIDQLASDSGSDADTAELAKRIARIWAMVAELDPELARRWSGYEDTRLGRASRRRPAR